MTTQEEQIEQPQTFVPDDREVTEIGGTSWRLANGKIVRGPQDKTEERDPNRLVGVIVRFGIHDDVTFDSYARRILQFEIDIQTSRGVESIHASLWNKEKDEFLPSGAAVQLARAAIEMAKNTRSCYMITASQGESWIDPKTGNSRSGTTYANLSIVDDKNQARRINFPRNNGPRRTYTEQWAELEPLLKACSLYKEREKRKKRDAGPTHFSELCKEVSAKGWPTPEEAPAEWLTLMSAAFEHGVKASLCDYGEDDWGAIRQTALSIVACPGVLAAAAAKLGKSSPAKAGAFA